MNSFIASVTKNLNQILAFVILILIRGHYKNLLYKSMQNKKKKIKLLRIEFQFSLLQY